MQTDALFAGWAQAWAPLDVSGRLKAAPEDFVVIEKADHLTGIDEGEHLYLFLQKRNLTTRELARALANANNVPISSIGYSGMKDKNAVTQQWLSIPLQQPITQSPEQGGTAANQVVVPDDVQELARVTRAKKLRRGWHRGNCFEIVLRDLNYCEEGDAKMGCSQALDARLKQIVKNGVPNYFGVQRFGADNLSRAIAWLPRRRRERDAFKRGLHLSVLRSYLFNTVLSARITDGSWNSPLAGDNCAEPVVTGPLWGRGRVQASAAVVDFEQKALDGQLSIAEELEFAGLKQERRPLQLDVQDLQWSFDEQRSLTLKFFLPPGGYATSVLRELGVFL